MPLCRDIARRLRGRSVSSLRSRQRRRQTSRTSSSLSPLRHESTFNLQERVRAIDAAADPAGQACMSSTARRAVEAKPSTHELLSVPKTATFANRLDLPAATRWSRTVNSRRCGFLYGRGSGSLDRLVTRSKPTPLMSPLQHNPRQDIPCPTGGIPQSLMKTA